MEQTLRVAIVGAGTAGPAAALHLTRRLPHATVSLFDKAQEPRAVGAGIGIQPIGLSALRKLGLLDTIKRHGARVDSIRTRTAHRNWPVLDVSYQRFDERLFGLGLHRGVLFEALLDECYKAERIDCSFGVDIADLEQTGDSVMLRSSKERPHGAFDLVVVADGTASRLRPLLGIPSRFRQYEYGALFALLPDEQRTFGSTLTQVHDGPGCHTTLGFLPTGVPWGHGIDTVGDGLVDMHAEFVTTLYYNLRADDYASWAAGGLERFKDECASLCPEAADLLQTGLVDAKQIAYARYSDGVLWRFNRGRVAVIGDAAHSMSPQLGQGCNLALIDAEKLADAIVTHGGSSRGVPRALEAYTHERWWRTQFYGAQSRFLTPLFASRSRLLRAFRDLAVYPACHTPIFKNYVHGVLCGAQYPLPVPGMTIPAEEYLGFLE